MASVWFPHLTRVRRHSMNKRTLQIGAAVVILLAVAFVFTNRTGTVEGQEPGSPPRVSQRGGVEQRTAPGYGFAAVPGLKGGQDVFGPYDPVQNWPRPLSESLPNHE